MLCSFGDIEFAKFSQTTRGYLIDSAADNTNDLRLVLGQESYLSFSLWDVPYPENHYDDYVSSFVGGNAVP